MSNAVKILWLSRHAATPSQVADLESHFGKIEIVQDSCTISHGKEVVQKMEAIGAAEAVVVLPPNLLQQCLGMGYQPLRAVMERKIHSDGEVDFIHQHFERVLDVIIKTEPL